MRKSLATLGFTSDLGGLPYVKARAFHLIASEISRLQDDEREKLSKKARKGR